MDADQAAQQIRALATTLEEMTRQNEELRIVAKYQNKEQ